MAKQVFSCCFEGKRDWSAMPQGKRTPKARWGKAERELMYKYLNGKGQMPMDAERFMNSQEYRHEFWELEPKFLRHPKKNFTQNSMRCINTWRAEQVQRETRRAAMDGVDDDEDEDDEYSSGDEKRGETVSCKFDNDLIMPQCHSLSPSSLIAALSF